MSLFQMTSIQCPVCDTLTDFDAAGSVNADRRPDLRDQIAENTFQTVTCPSCGEAMRLEPMFNYLDVSLGLWIGAYPPRQLGEYGSLEDQVKVLFAQSYGPDAAESAQEVGALLHARLTFSWPAIREKLLLRQSELDDVAIEMLKLDLLRRLPDAPLRPGVELRVIEVTEDTLGFVWVESDSEEVLQNFECSRALLSSIESNAEGWAPLRASLSEGMFVDMQKLYLDAGEDAA